MKRRHELMDDDDRTACDAVRSVKWSDDVCDHVRPSKRRMFVRSPCEPSAEPICVAFARAHLTVAYANRYISHKEACPLVAARIRTAFACVPGTCYGCICRRLAICKQADQPIPIDCVVCNVSDGDDDDSQALDAPEDWLAPSNH